jgi:phage repressor protein C with HTH and peptisase S24 domain
MSEHIDQVRQALRRVMARQGVKAKPLSVQAGLGPTAVRDILDRPGTDVRLGTLRKLADQLDSSVEELIGVESVVLAGRIGAGGSVIFEEEAFRTAPRPPGAGRAVEALEVIGDSMLPRYSEGDLVYISRSHDGVDESSMGEYCACRLTTGETYVKILARGTRPGFFTLRSLNAADIEDVELEWATPIIATVTRAARRSLGY